jgi:hypothetical protein
MSTSEMLTTNPLSCVAHVRGLDEHIRDARNQPSLLCCACQRVGRAHQRCSQPTLSLVLRMPEGWMSTSEMLATNPLSFSEQLKALWARTYGNARQRAVKGGGSRVLLWSVQRIG